MSAATRLAPVCREGTGLKQYIVEHRSPFEQGIALKTMPTISVRPVHSARLDDDFRTGGWDEARIRTADDRHEFAGRNVEGDIVYGLESDTEFKDH